jgi:hypothetical protein
MSGTSTSEAANAETTWKIAIKGKSAEKKTYTFVFSFSTALLASKTNIKGITINERIECT